MLSTPSLWAKINIRPPYTRSSMAILGRHLQLSGEYPLDISISYQDTFGEDDRGILSPHPPTLYPLEADADQGCFKN